MGKFYREEMPGARNRWRENVAQGQRRSAAGRKCPACGRKSALKRTDDGEVVYCRWDDCEYTRMAGIWGLRERRESQETEGE